MAFKIDRTYGQNYADNIVDGALLFDTGTWTVASGTGTASLDTNNSYIGLSGLKIENNTPASSITVTNSDEDTIIAATTGNYQLSWYVKKNIADEIRSGAVLVYKNAVLLDTQTFSVGSETTEDDINDTWVRFQSTTTYSFIKTDVITFQFRLDSATTAELTTAIWIDGFMLNKGERRNAIVPTYNFPDNILYNLYTGWAVYADTTYTTGSPFTVVDGAAAVSLPNNAGDSVTSQTPIDITTFYNGSTITGREGDGINLTFEFKCRPAGVGANPRLTVSIDIGGGIGELYPRDFFLNKGNGVEHNFISSFSVYSLDTWEANGGTVKVTATNEDIEIYDIRYVITRTHKAR